LRLLEAFDEVGSAAAGEEKGERGEDEGEEASGREARGERRHGVADVVREAQDIGNRGR
jgi:hypothetical protein